MNDNGRPLTRFTPSLAAAARPADAAPVAEERSAFMRHPAVVAWCRLHPDVVPVRVTPVKVRRKKSAVYRLEGAGWAGGVIAKRCAPAVARVERTVYEAILPRAAVPSLRYYGCLEDPDKGRCWLFMEEATGAPYSDLEAEHRALAGRWLGLLHPSVAAGAAPECLPKAGPARYLDLLRAVRGLLEEHRENPVLSTDDVVFLESTRARLDQLAGHWDRIEQICGRVPRTLVHGDFKGRNLRLQATGEGMSVVVFDWEHAGWGVPAVDLAQVTIQSDWLAANPDIPTYWSTVRARWPEVSLEAWWQLALCGTVFRTLAALHWKAPNLATAWAHMYVGGVQLYVTALDRALERLGWAPGGAAPRAARA